MNITIQIKHIWPGTVFILLISSLFIPEVAYATDVIIVIKEKGTGVPIEGATVVIDKGTVYDETDKTGRIVFTDIQLPGEIKVLATGFETLVKSISTSKARITLYLVPVVFEGKGLEVKAQRLVEKASKLSLSTSELINTAGSGGDPLKTITALPGIVSTGEGSAEVYMRGSNNNENITWVNNVAVGYLYHFGGFQSTINPDLIKDINVFLGGFPVKYGDALGGVIDAQLRTPRNDRMRYLLDISTITGSFLLEGPAGKAGGDSFFVSGRRSYLDLIFSPAKASKAFADESENDPDQVIQVPRFYDFQTLYHHQIKGGYLDTYVFAAGDELKLELRDSAKSDPQLAGRLSEKIEYQTAGFTWQQRWNKAWSHISTLAYTHSKNSVQAGRDSFGQAFYNRVEENAILLQPELRWLPRSDIQLSFGLSGSFFDIPVDVYAPRSYIENDPDYDFTTLNKYRLKKKLKVYEASPFINYRHNWTTKFSTQIGLRHTNIRITGGFSTHKFSPRATLEYKPNLKTLLTATWGQFIQTPAGEQIVESVGNPSLLMTEAEHRIIGIEYNLNSLYSIKAETYQKPMKNLVIAIDENSPPDNYSNQGSGEAYGFDIFIKRVPGQGKTGWLSLSWAKSTRTNEITGITRNFSGDQPLTITAVWGQRFGGAWKRWNWSMKAQAHSGRPYTAVTGRYREDPNDPNSRWIAEYGDHNGERLPAYYKVDFRIGREVLFNRFKMKFYLDLQNVTFAKNIVKYDYGNEYQNIDNPTEITGMSFFPYFGIQMEY